MLLGTTTTTGALQVAFNPDPSNYCTLTAGVRVLQTAEGNLEATLTGPQDRGLVEYSFEQIGADWYVTSWLKAAPLGGVVAGLQAAQSLVETVYAGIHGQLRAGGVVVMASLAMTVRTSRSPPRSRAARAR